MPKRYKIKQAKPESFQSPRIETPQLDDTAEVSFNFKRLSSCRSKFCYEDREQNYFLKLLERLRDVSHMSRREMIQNARVLRFHPIDFSDSEVSEDGFGIQGDDIGLDAWQFQLCSNEHGRVHGYFVGNIFYVVWLDPKHELYI